MKRVLKKSALLLLTLALILTTVISPAFADEVSDSAETRVSDVVLRPLPYGYVPEKTEELRGSLTTEKVYNSIVALKKKYPEGAEWDNDNIHTWYVGETNYIVDLYACYGWAAMCSDKAFGDVNGDYPIRKYFVKSGADKTLCVWCPDGRGTFTYSSLRPGDILRVNNDGHSVVVLEKYDDHIVICEGNYGGTVHWGREMTKAEVMKADYVITRYPEPPVMTSAANKNGAVAVSWEAEADASGYRIWRKEGSGSWKKLADTDTNSYTDKPTKMGTVRYRVQSEIPGISRSHYSDSVKVTFNPFKDVSTKDDAYPYIAWAYNNNVVKGTSDTTFSPDESCTRMNFVMILWKMSGRPEVEGENPFSDVSGAKSEMAVKWAVDKGIVKGTSETTFSPENKLSRINIIMILWKMAGSPKVSGSNPFTDVSGTKTIRAVKWAVKKGIISGTSSTEFSPDADCSRALLVEILYKYNELYPILK